MSGGTWGWISPRKQRADAIRVGEHIADDWEHYLGRPLTPAELREAHEQAGRIVAEWARRARKGQ